MSCYICNRTDGLQEHHIRPRTAGGEDGPTVDLCATCHQLAHHNALNILSKQPNKQFFPDHLEKRANKIVRFLVVAIREEREKPDFNHPYTFHFKTTKGVAYFLHILKAEAGYTNLNTFILSIFGQMIRNRFGTLSMRTNQERLKKPIPPRR